MTKVKFVYEDNNYLISLTGHSGYATENDIVCAACSCLAETLHNLLELLEREDKLKIIQFDKTEAFRIYQVKTDSLNSEEVRTAIRAITIGYQLLANTYPENVEVEYIFNE